MNRTKQESALLKLDIGDQKPTTGGVRSPKAQCIDVVGHHERAFDVTRSEDLLEGIQHWAESREAGTGSEASNCVSEE